MTRWMLNKPIPSTIVAPENKALEAPSRAVEVTGAGTLPECPNCGRKGPLDVLTVGDGATWPNMVVVCGRSPSKGGCGVYWCLTPVRPHDLRSVE